jgi:hypothetical protein
MLPNRPGTWAVVTETQQSSKYLRIYLQDHLAGATAGLEIAKRAAAENEGSELGTFLAGLSGEIAADRQALIEIMDSCGAEPDQLKQALAWVGEKAGRLKLNGQVLGHSPLSPLVELEALEAGITGKLLLWRALADAAGDRFEPGRLDELIARAERQRTAVESHRLTAARVAFSA